MGLYDNNSTIVANDVKVVGAKQNGTFSNIPIATGELFRIQNSDLKYKTLAIRMELAVADNDGDTTFNWYYEARGDGNPILHREDGALLYSRGNTSDYGSYLTIDDIHNYQLDNVQVQSGATQQRILKYSATFYIDVTLINTFIVYSRNTNNNVTISSVSYTLMNDIPDIFSRKTIQCLFRKSVTLQAGTSQYGGANDWEIRRFIPDFKYIFVTIKSAASISGTLSVNHQVGRVKNISGRVGYNYNDVIHTDNIVISDSSTLATDWIEIKGNGCNLSLVLSEAVSQDTNLNVQIFGVR